MFGLTFCNRLAAIPPPMLPRPMNPILSASVLLTVQTIVQLLRSNPYRILKEYSKEISLGEEVLSLAEVGIYKENKKTRFRPRKRSRKKEKERKRALDQESDQEKTITVKKKKKENTLLTKKAI